MTNHGESPDMMSYVAILTGPWCDGVEDAGMPDCPVGEYDLVRGWMSFTVSWDGSPVRTNVIYVNAAEDPAIADFQWYWVGDDDREFVVFDSGEDLDYAAAADNNPGYQFNFDRVTGEVVEFDQIFDWGPIDYTGQPLGVEQLTALQVLAEAAGNTDEVERLEAMIQSLGE